MLVIEQNERQSSLIIVHDYVFVTFIVELSSNSLVLLFKPGIFKPFAVCKMNSMDPPIYFMNILQYCLKKYVYNNILYIIHSVQATS